MLFYGPISAPMVGYYGVNMADLHGNLQCCPGLHAAMSAAGAAQRQRAGESKQFVSG